MAGETFSRPSDRLVFRRSSRKLLKASGKFRASVHLLLVFGLAMRTLPKQKANMRMKALSDPSSITENLKGRRICFGALFAGRFLNQQGDFMGVEGNNDFLSIKSSLMCLRVERSGPKWAL